MCVNVLKEDVTKSFNSCARATQDDTKELFILKANSVHASKMF